MSLSKTFFRLSPTADIIKWINWIILKMHHSTQKILFVFGCDEYLERPEEKIRKCLFKNNSVI